MRIAVVGSGIAGLGSAWLLSQKHDVVLFEADDRLGGHTDTHSVAVGDRVVDVDTGFIVFNETHYPLLTRLFFDVFNDYRLPTHPARAAALGESTLGMGLSLLDLAPLVDCDPGNLSRIERRVQVPRADVAARIAAALALDEREILYPERYVEGDAAGSTDSAGGGGDGR